MRTSIYVSTGPDPADCHGFDHAIGLQPTPLDLKIHHNLGLLGTAPGQLPDAVLTFLVACIGLWAADKIVPRASAPDAWTRRLRVSCPAVGWSEALAALSALAGFLTGDEWSLEARPVQPFLELQARPDHSWQPDCVCLLSGGVDSLAGAIALLEAGHRVLLVSHYDFGQLASSQNLLTEHLIRHYGPDKIRRWGFRIQFEAPELSLRSRSLLFIALGLAAAAVWQIPTLYIPENGWISLNPPLTSTRLGSYSTRTTHPYFMSGLKQFFTQGGNTAGFGQPFSVSDQRGDAGPQPQSGFAADAAALLHFLRPSGGLPVAERPPGKLRLLFPLPDAAGRAALSGLGRRAGIPV